MTVKDKIAFLLYLLTSIIIIISGIIYFSSSEFMPYHAQAIGKSWDELDASLQVLLRGLVNRSGATMFGFARAQLILTVVPFRRGERWARFAIPVIVIPTNVTVLYGALMVKLNTPANPPSLMLVVVAIMNIVAFAISMVSSAETGESS